MAYINKLIKKYKKIWQEMDMMDDYDAAKVEMAHDFEKELQELSIKRNNLLEDLIDFVLERSF